MIAALPVRERKASNWEKRIGGVFRWNPPKNGHFYMSDLMRADRPGTLATVNAILKERGAK